MQKGLKSIGILDLCMRMEGNLFALSIDLKHEIVSPFVVSKSSWQFVGYPCHLPVDVALLTDFVDVVRDQPVVALYV